MQHHLTFPADITGLAFFSFLYWYYTIWLWHKYTTSLSFERKLKKEYNMDSAQTMFEAFTLVDTREIHF
jgi:hypothetical protein